MISMLEVRKTILAEDQKAQRNVDRPREYVIQRWIEVNKASAKPQDKEDWELKVNPKIVETIIQFFEKNSDSGFIAALEIIKQTGLARSTCSATLKKMFDLGFLIRKGGGQGAKVEYKLVSKNSLDRIEACSLKKKQALENEVYKLNRLG